MDENWGNKSIGTLARHLNRSEEAIRLKAYKMGLGAFLDNGDYVTWKKFLKAFGMESYYRTTSWIEKRNFPIHTKKVRNHSFLVVKLEEFWKWAEENKEMLDFSKLEENMLGKEPEWVKEKRRVDFEKNQKYKTSPWTKTEDEKLMFLLRQQKYTCYEITQKLGRTEGAIRIRMSKLKIKDKPLRVKRQRWTEEKKEMLFCLIEEGYGYELIAEQMECSSKNIRSFILRTYGFENLDKVRKVLKEHERL